LLETHYLLSLFLSFSLTPSATYFIKQIIMNIYDALLKKLTRRVSAEHSSTPPSSEVTSKASSLSDATSPAAQAKYLLDPMRTNSHPDLVGYFVDPMGGRSSYHASYDLTNTGA
jgi:hypothetical protein